MEKILIFGENFVLSSIITFNIIMIIINIPNKKGILFFYNVLR